jgi:hypothetical protein
MIRTLQPQTNRGYAEVMEIRCSGSTGEVTHLRVLFKGNKYTRWVEANRCRILRKNEANPFR